MAQNQRIVQEVSRCVKTSQEVTTCLALALEFLFGFVPHGYYEDISYGVDFYSGHLVIEPLGEHKITDLKKPILKWKII